MASLMLDFVLLGLTMYAALNGMYIALYTILVVIVAATVPLIYAMYGNNRSFTRTYISAHNEALDVFSSNLIKTLFILILWVGMLAYLNIWVMVGIVS